jgi:hypothetical protein
MSWFFISHAICTDIATHDAVVTFLIQELNYSVSLRYKNLTMMSNYKFVNWAMKRVFSPAS